MATGLTTNYNIPFPVLTDPVNVHEDMQSLAETVDATLRDILKTYLAVNVQASKRDEEKLKRLEVMKDLLRKGSVSLSGAFTDLIKTYGYQHETDGEYNTFLGNGFLRPSPKVKEYLASVLEDSFLKYDKDRSSTLQKAEVSSFFLLLYF